MGLHRVAVALMALGLALTWSLTPVQAQSSYPLDPQAWTGGNGWCEDGVCFRAWATSGGVEIRWLVASPETPRLTVMRRELQPATREAVPVAESDCSVVFCPAEFTYQDTAALRGAVYQYMLVEAESADVLGQALEAGVAASAVDPGGSSPHRIFLPLTLSQGR